MSTPPLLLRMLNIYIYIYSLPHRGPAGAEAVASRQRATPTRSFGCIEMVEMFVESS
jgi:hypothetical protein